MFNNIFLDLSRNSFEKHLNEIKSMYEGVLDLKSEYASQAKKLRDEYDKDEDVKRLKDEIEEIKKNSIYIGTNKEREAITNFRKEHYVKCLNRSKFTYTLTGTGIGTNIEIKCPVCGEARDVSDYESW